MCVYIMHIWDVSKEKIINRIPRRTRTSEISEADKHGKKGLPWIE